VSKCYTENMIKMYHNKKYQTPQAIELKNALEARGVEVYEEFHDGFKTIDLRLPEAKIDVEVDGVHHLTDAKQILSDLDRGKYSHRDGYDTMHIPNKMIHAHLEEIADALAQASKTRKQKLHIYVK